MIRWMLDNPNDTIQKHLANNRFFEIQDLEFMKQFIDSNTVIIDIGANIGNHSVYFSKFTDAKTIYVIEPIPRAYKLLLANIALNYCHNINSDFIGLALGDNTGLPKSSPVQTVSGGTNWKLVSCSEYRFTAGIREDYY